MLKYAFLIFTAIWTLSSAAPQWVSDAKGRKYLIDDSHQYNWMQAWDYCARSSLQLVVLDSESKNSDFVAMLKKTFNKQVELWLGAEDEINTKGTEHRPFYWHATGKSSTYSYWTKGNPDNSAKKEHCVKIAKNDEYKWNDYPCSGEYGFACEENHFLTAYKADLVSKQSKVDKANTKVITQYHDENSKNQEVQNVSNQTIQQIQSEMVDALEQAFTAMQSLIKEKNNLILQIQAETDTELNNSTADFQKVLEANKKEVNGILVW